MTSATPSTPDIPSCADCIAMGYPMPDLLIRMERGIGIAATRAFLERWAGSYFYIPFTDRNVEEPTASTWLREHIGSGKIAIPLGPMGRQKRNAWIILNRMRAGESLWQIASALGISIRTVSNHKARFQKSGLLAASLPKLPTKDPS